MRRSLISRALDYLTVARHARNLTRNQDELVRSRSRDIVIARLGRLRGLGQKVGQISALRGDAECTSYEKLTDSCDPLPWRVMRKELRRSWGCKPEERLAWVDEHGFGASIGQVHKARLHDGRTWP